MSSANNPVLALCTALGVWAATALPIVRVAPNRLLSGEPVYVSALISLPSLMAWLLVPMLIFLIVRRVAHPPSLSRAIWEPVLLLAMSSCAMGLLLWLAGSYATRMTLSDNPLVRTSLGAGFWSLMAVAWLISLDSLQHLKPSFVLRSALVAMLILPIGVELSMGWGDDLSIMREYFNHREVFWQAVLRHLQIVAVATVPSVVVGLPLAWACQRFAPLSQVMLPTLNIIQTLPSIALFGLFMAPLAWLATRYPALADAGLSGVGLAPAVLALVLYSLLPIVRSAMAGLAQVPDAAKTAAQAMGMTAWQIFYQVELQLALPVLLPGLRTAVVQTVGLAAVTALVGAGGLGALMFDGLFSAANELVLLGVLPIVLLAALADTAFKALTAWIDPVKAEGIAQ